MRVKLDKTLEHLCTGVPQVFKEEGEFHWERATSPTPIQTSVGFICPMAEIYRHSTVMLFTLVVGIALKQLSSALSPIVASPTDSLNPNYSHSSERGNTSFD